MIRLAVVNLDWQRGHNAELVDQACRGADVVLACEALAGFGKQPADLAELLPDGWRTNQDTSSVALAGSAVCWRTAIMSAHKPDDHVEASRRGFRVRPRFLAPALLTYKPSGDTRRYVPFHAPLRTTGRQAEFYRNLSRYLNMHPHAVAGGDGNRPPRWVTGRTGRYAVGAEVISVLLPHDLAGLTRPVRHDTSPWTDHPIVRVQLDPRSRR